MIQSDLIKIQALDWRLTAVPGVNIEGEKSMFDRSFGRTKCVIGKKRTTKRMRQTAYLFWFALVGIVLFPCLVSCVGSAVESHEDHTAASSETNPVSESEESTEQSSEESHYMEDLRHRIACVGDSLTFGAGLFAPTSYPSVLQTLLGSENCLVANYSEQGRVLSEGYGERTFSERTAYRNSIQYAPQTVIILLGTNDAWHCEVFSEAGQTCLKNSLTALVTAYRVAGAEQIYVGLPPFTENEAMERKLRDIIRPILVSTADQLNCSCIDFYPLTANGDYLQSDGIHLTDQGYRQMAEIVYQRFLADGLVDN